LLVQFRSAGTRRKNRVGPVRRLLHFVFLLLFPAVAFSQGNSLLWRISGNSMPQPSYLYGTMHTADPRVFHFADSVMPAFESCEAFALEVVLDDQLMHRLLNHVFMDDGVTLKTLLTPGQYDSLRLFLLRHGGFELSLFDRMKPVYTAMMLEALIGNEPPAAGSGPVLDRYLQESAQAQQKPVLGLETMEEQLSVLDALSYADQSALLMQTMRDFTGDTLALERMMQLYLNNDLAAMMEFEKDFSIPDSLADALITKRNVNMARRIDSLIRHRSVFIAVGAGHLGKEYGLVSLLRERGYSVIPVIPTYGNYLRDGWYSFTSKKNEFRCDFPSLPACVDTSNRAHYSSMKKEGVRKELFEVIIFTAAGDEQRVENLFPPRQLRIQENGAEKFFTGETTDGRQVAGKLIFSHEKTYLIRHSSKQKSKERDRFIQSFSIFAE
jgi:hypothetical protein